MPKIRVLVVDDHTLLRDGITALLDLVPDIEVVGEASNGKEALERVKELRPDVVLMDIEMPVMDGLEAARKIRARFPAIKVLTLSQYDDSTHVLDAVEAGVQGFMTKTAASAELAASIRSVYRGDSYLSPTAARQLVGEFQRAEHPRSDDPYDQLTTREKEVLRLIAEGKTTQQIADILVISLKTAEGHRTNLMAKLGVHDRIELVKFAVRRGIISI
ncbi:MAG TPA: response regulator transcription factor [Thermoleophilia bacterium]|nr:response regulator transcription factor [Thermoleophilia bacterium]